MREFWLFRSNLTSLEYYHEYKELSTFEKNCHDYYLLLPLWLLKNDYYDQVVIWRLTKYRKSDIVFDIGNKKFIQRWVTNFNHVYDYTKPEISFFRGGFKEYCDVVKEKPKQFGIKLYLGAGVRQYPKFGGKYDYILMEDERDYRDGFNCIPFYKTASPHIFYPYDTEKEFDICWPANWTQLKYKGFNFFMDRVSKSDFLKSLKIAHCGNKSEIGKNLVKKYGINNITFLGYKSRNELNDVLNKSKIALNLSNQRDGCPRVSTEVLMSGTPLILRDTVRLLKYFRKFCANVNDKNFDKKIKDVFENYEREKNNVIGAIGNELSFSTICKKNIDLWKKT